jgi:hypothetical protein
MAQKTTKPEQPKMRAAIRVAKFEVDSVVGQDWKEVLPRWFATADFARRAANLYHETWLLWHVQNQSAFKIIDWLERRKSEGIKQAGECPVKCFTPELSKLIYDTLKTRYASLQIDVVTSIMNVLQKTISSGKAANGSLPKWTSILLHNEAMPMFTRSFPVPFDKKNAKLSVDGENRFVDLKLWRMPVEGKTTNIAVVDRIKLRMTGKSAKAHLAKFDKIASGEWEFKGSEFVYDKNNKKWFVNLCHQCPSSVESLDPNKKAYLIPGRNNAFYLRVRGQRKQWLQGRGHHITSMRERVWTKRAELNSGSKKTTSLRGGHGTKAAMKWRERWSRTWREFVKRVNHCVSKDAIDWCVLNGVGTLVYLKPNGQCSENRFVSGNFKNSTWEFFDLQSKLRYKGEGRGVLVEVVECGKESASGSVTSNTSEPLAETKVNPTKRVATKRKPTQ